MQILFGFVKQPMKCLLWRSLKLSDRLRGCLENWLGLEYWCSGPPIEKFGCYGIKCELSSGTAQKVSVNLFSRETSLTLQNLTYIVPIKLLLLYK